jgi:azurin
MKASLLFAAPLFAGLLLAGSATASNCTIELGGDDMMKFDKNSVTVSASCPEITITLKHTGKLPLQSMGHNVVISPTADYLAAAQDGMKAGLPNQYVQPGDSRVIAFTKVIGGGETTTQTFKGSLLTPGTAYTFYCSFPGHWAIMKGALIVEA